MEVIKCNTKVAMETAGEVRNLNSKSKMAERRFAFVRRNSCWPTETNYKNKNTTKSTQTWLKVWEKGQINENSTLSWWNTSTKISIKKIKIFYAEVRTKDGSFYNFNLLRLL